MLKKALKLDRVHTFGNLSVSQLIEKIDLMTEIVFFNQINRSKTKTQTLITIISLAYSGLLSETYQEHKEQLNRSVKQEIPGSTDFTKLYKNFT